MAEAGSKSCRRYDPRNIEPLNEGVQWCSACFFLHKAWQYAFNCLAWPITYVMQPRKWLTASQHSSREKIIPCRKCFVLKSTLRGSRDS
eukprot:2943868-Amphidinium_carterae.1